MKWGERPVILAGHGVRGAGLAHRAHEIFDIGLPVLTSWQAADLLDNDHPLYFGRPGLYGQRAANKVLKESDHVLAIGNRCSLWNVGYNGLDGKRLDMVDCDRAEVDRLSANLLGESIAGFLDELPIAPRAFDSWIGSCAEWRIRFPWVEPGTHADTGFINPHRFCDALQKHFDASEIIVTEMGTALVSAFQTLRLKPPQRLLTSGGLGEMGVGLPAAVGAAFGSGRRVVLLSTDGGMMMNLHELQTIRHHNLPVKIIVFENGGYEMLRQTQRNAGYRYAGVHPSSGLSLPAFDKIAHSFGIKAGHIGTWAHFDQIMPMIFGDDQPCLAVYHMDPNADVLLPKLNPIRHPDGRIESPQFDQMSPML